jgi:predicted amidophosphoribosyltransferase
MGYDRNRELGDRCGFCLSCGWGRRFMAGAAGSLPERCPDCGGEVVSECPGCGEPIVSLMGITCRACGHALREPTLFGVEIRRKPEKVGAGTARVDGDPDSRDNVSRSR